MSVCTGHGESFRVSSPPPGREVLSRLLASACIDGREVESGQEQDSHPHILRCLGLVRILAGIKTAGVDDEGLFNCCIKLNMPGIFDELQDVWES